MSMVLAMKMLIYLLPEWANLETTLLYAGEMEEPVQLPGGNLAREWINDHFPRITYTLIPGREKEILSRLSAMDPSCMVVAGAYHRSRMSMWLSRSMADLLMREISLPLFVAHS